MLHLPIQETAREADCKYNKIISKNYKFKLFFHLMLVYDIIFIESYLLFCERFINIWLK